MLKNRCLLLSFTTLLSIPLLSQSYPKVPADYPGYKHQMEIIARTGTFKRNEWKYIIYDGNVTAERYKDQVTKYYKNGQIQEIENVNSRRQNTSIIIFEYDNRELPKLKTEFLPTGTIIGKTTYNYDPKGNLKEVTRYNENEYIISKTEYSVNPTAQTVTERKLFSPDSVKEKIIYYYTDLKNGRVKKKAYFTGEHHLDHTVIYHYLDDGRIDKEENTGPDGKTISYLEYHYSPKGWLQEKVWQYPKGIRVKQFDLQYNNSGLITGQLEYGPKGEMINYCKYTYNNADLPEY